MAKWPIFSWYKDWQATITIGGITKYLRTLPSRRLGFDVQTSTCTIEYTSLLEIDSPFTWADIDISIHPRMHIDERIVRRFFSGFITPDIATYGSSIQYPAIVTDPSFLLDTTTQWHLVWQNTPFVNAVNMVWGAARIPMHMRGHILDPGPVYTLGSDYIIVIPPTTNLKTVMQKLMEFAGTKMVSLGDGKLHVVSGCEIPPMANAVRYDTGREDFALIAGAMGFENMQRRFGTWSMITESITVMGPKGPNNFTPGYYFEVDPDIIPAGIVGRRESITHEYIQNDIQAEAIAKQYIRRHARIEERVEIRAPTHPTLLPGMGIMLRNPGLGYHTFQPGLILSQAIDGDGMTLVVSLGPSLVPGVGAPIGAYDDNLSPDPVPMPPFDPEQPAFNIEDYDPIIPPGYAPIDIPFDIPIPSWNDDPAPDITPIAPPGFEGDFPPNDFDPVLIPTFPPIDLPPDFPFPWQPFFELPPFLPNLNPASVCVSYARPYIAEDDPDFGEFASPALWVNYASGTRYEWNIPDHGEIWAVNRERIGDMIWAAGKNRVYCAYDGAFLGVDIFEIGIGNIHHIHTTDNVGIWVGFTITPSEAGWGHGLAWSLDGGATWTNTWGTPQWNVMHYDDVYGLYNPLIGVDITDGLWTFYFTNQQVTTSDAGQTWIFEPYDEENPQLKMSDYQHGIKTWTGGSTAVEGSAAIGEANASSVHTHDETGTFVLGNSNLWLNGAVHQSGYGSGTTFHWINHYFYNSYIDTWQYYEQSYIDRVAVDGFHQVVHSTLGISYDARPGHPGSFTSSQPNDLFTSCGVGLPVPPVIVTAHFASTLGWVSYIAGERHHAHAGVSCVNRISVGDVLWAAGNADLFRCNDRTLMDVTKYFVPTGGVIQRMYTSDNTNIYVVAKIDSGLEVWYHPAGGAGEGWQALHLGSGFDSALHHNAIHITVSNGLITVITEKGALTSPDHGATWISEITRGIDDVNTDRDGPMLTMARGGAPFSTTGHPIGEVNAVSVFDEWTLGVASVWRGGESYHRAPGAGDIAYPYHRIVHHAADAILACTVGYAMYTKGNMSTPVVQKLLLPSERFWDVGL